VSTSAYSTVQSYGLPTSIQSSYCSTLCRALRYYAYLSYHIYSSLCYSILFNSHLQHHVLQMEKYVLSENFTLSYHLRILCLLLLSPLLCCPCLCCVVSVLLAVYCVALLYCALRYRVCLLPYNCRSRLLLTRQLTAAHVEISISSYALIIYLTAHHQHQRATCHHLSIASMSHFLYSILFYSTPPPLYSILLLSTLLYSTSISYVSCLFMHRHPFHFPFHSMQFSLLQDTC